MRVGIIFAYVDYHRRGQRNRLSMQPQSGPLIAGLLPPDVEIDVVNETWETPDWERDYDLLFISAMHSLEKPDLPDDVPNASSNASTWTIT